MLRKIIKMSVFLCMFFAAGIAEAQSFASSAKNQYDDFAAKSRKQFSEFSNKARKTQDEFTASSREKAGNKGSDRLEQHPAASDTTSLKIPVKSPTSGETYFLSPSAADVYAKNGSLDGLVKVTVSDGEVYALPEEKMSYPIWYESEKSRLNKNGTRHTEGSAEGQPAENLCPPNTPECEDLLVLWPYMGVKSHEIPNLVRGAEKNGFAETLKKDKRLCLGICDNGIKVVERRQRKRLLGESFDVASLEQFMWEGGFTASGWVYTFEDFCRQGRVGKLSEGQIDQLKPFAKRTEKAWKKKEIPVIHLSNRDPWGGLNDGALTSALSCIKDF